MSIEIAIPSVVDKRLPDEGLRCRDVYGRACRMSGAFILEEHKNLFKDESSYNAFLAAFKDATQKGLAVVLSGSDVIGAVLSPSCTKQVLMDRMVQSIAKKPELLADLAARMNEPIVDLPERQSE